PRPSDAGDASAVRKWMTRASVERLAELSKDPTEYQKMVRGALEAMVSDQIPTAKDVAVVEEQGTFGTGEWSGVLSRQGAGERLVCAATFGNDWNGDLVIGGKPEGRAAVLIYEMFVPNKRRQAATKDQPKVPYVGYQLGYNRSVLAERVHDLLSVIAFARGQNGVKSVKVIATKSAAPAALV